MKPFEQLGKGGQFRRLKRMAEQALRDYDLPPGRLTPLAHEANTTFRLDTEDGARYVVRIQTPDITAARPTRSLEDVRSEMTWLAALRRDTDLVVPEPVPTRSGDFVTRARVAGVPEERVCVLFRWVEGRFLDDGLTPRHLERVGRFTAELHRHAMVFEPPSGFSRALVHDVSPEVCEQMVRLFADFVSAEAATTVETFLHGLRGILDGLGQDREEFGLIHADLHQSNYLFHRGEVRAIDFDDCGRGNYLYDLSVTLSELEHRDDLPALRAALLRGYRSHHALSAEHEAYLPAFVELRRLQLAVWFVEQRNHPAFPHWAEDVDFMVGKLRDASTEL